jgi:hypothetical protein
MPINGRLPCRWRGVARVCEDGRARLMEVRPFVSCSHVGEVWKSAPLLMGVLTLRQFAAFCLVTNNTLHVRLADYAMISTMSGR